jgi:alkylhydroperoxidase/carboxymuconolactone decarboxylase family protein YurZ
MSAPINEPDPHRDSLRERFVREHGYWRADLEPVLSKDPALFEAYCAFSAVACANPALDPVVRELVLIAVNASVTQLHVPGLRAHIRNALTIGVPEAQILEVLEIVSVLGIHTVSVGLPAVLSVAEATDIQIDRPPPTGEQELAKDEFIRSRGYWNPFWQTLLSVAPQYFSAYTTLSALPWTSGTLEPKVREFIYVAADSAVTHLYEPGLTVHVQNALRLGATIPEIVEVLQLTSTVGIHAATVGIPVLIEELQRLKSAPPDAE